MRVVSSNASSRTGAAFPAVRMRRLRRTEGLRRLTRETELQPSDLIAPLFVTEVGTRSPIPSMPGVYQLSVNEALDEVGRLADLGVYAVLLFGLPGEKDETGSAAFAEDGIIQTAVRSIRAAHPNTVVITDVCLCEYTSHGHCGLLRGDEVDNDSSLEVLTEVAVSHARAGADIVAPSNMMDGTVAALRGGLDADGFTGVPVMAYSSKYASAFYGPFREAAGSAPAFGDRRSYQMDPANAREALREVQLDVDEGADLVIVKPALAYLDILYRVRERFELPVVAYNVSGEYSMVKAGALSGWLDERRIVLETLTGMKRAGADMIITYHAADAARWLSEGRE